MTAPFMGLYEVAQHYQVSKQVASIWRKRGQLPEPKVLLAMGPVWETEVIQRWPMPGRKNR